MSADPIVRICQACDQLAADLDLILNRIVNPDPVLALERESVKWWIVTDSSRGLVMFRSGYPACVRFATAFRRKHPETRLDGSFGLFADVLSERGAGATCTGRAQDPAGSCALAVPRSESTPSSGEEPQAGRSVSLAASPSVKDEPASSPENHSVRVPLADVIQIRPGKVVA